MNKAEFMNSLAKYGISEKDEEILRYCQDRKVLDVGCVGQQRSYGKNWLHQKIVDRSGEAVGVDIDREGIEELVGRGFNIVHVSDLEISDRKFDVIVMGDVIEHVDNISEFLEFYSRYLEPDGIMIITTPNPFSARQSIHTLLYGKPSINNEHTTNLDPITMAELAERGGFQIQDFSWLKDQKEITRLRDRLIDVFASFFILLRKYYSQNFLMVISR